MRSWPLLACALAGVAAPALATLSANDLTRAVARPPAEARLPMLAFSDAQGRNALLAVYAQGKPLVLIFADFTCRNICSPGLTLTAARLHETGLRAGHDYQLAVIGLDPKDTLADALHFVQAIRGTPDVARATLLLRGRGRTVAAATRALGYGHVYDAANDQFAHDASVYVFASDGTLTTVLPEIGLLAPPLKAAIEGDEAQATGWAARVAHVCYGFAAAHGRFDRPIVIGLQALSASLLCGVGLLFWRRRAA
jgi:protein SCO1/2